MDFNTEEVITFLLGKLFGFPCNNFQKIIVKKLLKEFCRRYMFIGHCWDWSIPSKSIFLGSGKISFFVHWREGSSLGCLSALRGASSLSLRPQSLCLLPARADISRCLEEGHALSYSLALSSLPPPTSSCCLYCLWSSLVTFILRYIQVFICVCACSIWVICFSFDCTCQGVVQSPSSGSVVSISRCAIKTLKCEINEYNW